MTTSPEAKPPAAAPASASKQPPPVEVEGTLELTIKKAELTSDEPLAEFTQSYVCVRCQGHKNRTPNAAQKDQHKPVWNATIRIPVKVNCADGAGESADDDSDNSDADLDEDEEEEEFDSDEREARRQ